MQTELAVEKMSVSEGLVRDSSPIPNVDKRAPSCNAR